MSFHPMTDGQLERVARSVTRRHVNMVYRAFAGRDSVDRAARRLRRAGNHDQGQAYAVALGKEMARA